MNIKIKRVYEPPDKEDGQRILIDRLWPRGLTKEKAKVDEWLKELAPSTELRKWFNHDPEKWKEFQKRYHQELKENKDYNDKKILTLSGLEKIESYIKSSNI